MFGIDPLYIQIAALALVCLAGVLMVIGFVPEEFEEDELYGYRERKRNRLLQTNIVYRLVLPLVKIFAHYVAKIGDDTVESLGRLRAYLRDRLPRSGYIGAYSANEFLGLCCVSGLGGFLFVLLMTVWMTGIPRPLLAALMGPVGMALPFLNLNGAITQRLVEFDRRLPYTMDLLVLSMRAGLDFMSALDRVVEQGREQNPDDPIVQELGVVLQELRVGTPRADALQNLVDRVQSDYLESMVGAIVQSEERGTPLATVLEVQVETIRKKRSQRIEKQASQAAVKVLLPLMFIFMSVIILVVGMMILHAQGTM
ncbi:MAG: type II secretion system F family protein [Bradymonadaceae bacterium]